MSPARLLPLALAAGLAAACGGSQTGGSSDETVADFDCKDRRAEYSLVGGFVAKEEGIAVWCEGGSVWIESWRIVDNQGTRKADKAPMTQLQFEELWAKIESAGWRNLGDCDNPEAGDADPIYTIAIRDHSAEVTLMCQGKGELPFPYNRLVNELDLKAAGFTQ